MFKVGDTVMVSFANDEDIRAGLSEGDIGWVVSSGVSGAACKFLTANEPEIWMGRWQIQLVERKSND